MDIDEGLGSIHLICSRCGYKYPPHYSPTICEKCGYPLDIDIPKDLLYSFDPSLPGVYRYIPRSMLKKDVIISLGEGDTPVVKVSKNLYFKLEYLNPSGSFKDRGAATSIKIVHDFGYRNVAEDSSGNAGASIALYSNVYGLNAYIFIPRNAPINKRNYIELLGAKLHLCTDRGEAYQKALNYSKTRSIYYIGHLVNPYFNLGLESIAFENSKILGWIDNIVVPVGSGGLYLGIYNGLKKMREMGKIDYIPKIHAIEAEGYVRLSGDVDNRVKSKLGDGVRVPGPPRKSQLMDAIRDTGGAATWVGDNEIRIALTELIKMGFIVEPTSALAYAGYKKLLETYIPPDENTLIILTGSGLKMLGELHNITRYKAGDR